MSKYICTKTFSLYGLDDNGEIDETQEFDVESGSIWSKGDAELVDVRLTRDTENSHQWIEIAKEALGTHFKPFDPTMNPNE